MSITRRSFLALAAVAAPSSAMAFSFTWGSNSNGPSFQQNDSGAMDFMGLVRPNNVAFTAREGLIVTDTAAYFGAFTRGVRSRDENRIGILRDIPVAGVLFTDRLRSRDFDPNLQIGLVYAMGQTLVVDLHRTRVTVDVLATSLLAGGGGPAPTLTIPNGSGGQQVVQSLVTVNQTTSFHVRGTVLAPVNPASPPAALRTLAQPGQATQVGQAYRHASGHLLTLVRPSILTGWS